MPAASGAGPKPGRATVWVNCAVSADGRLAFARGARARLSGSEDLVRVQQLRRQVDAILVGVGTVILDDPSLRVHWDLLGESPGREPARIVVDSTGRTPEGARVLDGRQPTILAVSARCRRTFPSHVRTIAAGEENVDLATVFARLPELGIQSVLVEGGAGILAEVARRGLFDRWTTYYASRFIGGRTAPAMLSGAEATGMEATVPLILERVERLGEGFVASYLPGPRPAAAPGPAAPP